jgi:excisionase family DNA binding protein
MRQALINPKPVLSSREASALIGVHQRTVQRWLSAGLLPGQRFGPKVWRISRNDLEMLRDHILQRTSVKR